MPSLVILCTVSLRFQNCSSKMLILLYFLWLQVLVIPFSDRDICELLWSFENMDFNYTIATQYSRLDEERFVHIIIVVVLGSMFNLIANSVVTKDPLIRWRKLEFVLVGSVRDSFCTIIRYFILCNQGVCFALLWPLTVFETSSTQFMGDRYSGRSPIGICWAQVCNCLRVAVVEGAGTLIGVNILEIADVSLPATPASLLSMVYFCPVFDAGLDLGFYTFHRVCHKNDCLYKLIHADHHTNTDKKYGRLVAYETYTITWIETISITSSYFIGLIFIIIIKGLQPLTLFELATLITWGHSVELIGHTAMSSTPKWHPMRLIVELLGLDLLVIDHTMHHKVPKANFSKRMTLLDHICNTYTSRNASIACKAEDELNVFETSKKEN